MHIAITACYIPLSEAITDCFKLNKIINEPRSYSGHKIKESIWVSPGYEPRL